MSKSFAVTAPEATMGNGNTPLANRGTLTFADGSTHVGFPEAVEQHLRRGATPTSCHLWAGFNDRGGYPLIDYAGFKFSARVWIYEYINDCKAIKGKQVRVSCGNGRCVNPEHLYEGEMTDEKFLPGSRMAPVNAQPMTVQRRVKVIR